MGSVTGLLFWAPCSVRDPSLRGGTRAEVGPGLKTDGFTSMGRRINMGSSSAVDGLAGGGVCRGETLGRHVINRRNLTPRGGPRQDSVWHDRWGVHLGWGLGHDRFPYGACCGWVSSSKLGHQQWNLSTDPMLMKWFQVTRLETRTKESDMHASIRVI